MDYETESAEVMQTIRYSRVLLLIWVTTLSGCQHKTALPGLLQLYRQTACVPAITDPRITPPTRAWNNIVLRTRAGVEVTLYGAQMSGGFISARFSSGGPPEEIAISGDYIYPADVRFDFGRDLLYVKSDGLRGDNGVRETWLFEYDLKRRQQTQRVLVVDRTQLPPECPQGGVPR